MNRAERRRSGARKEATYTLTHSQIKQMKVDAVKEAVDRAFILMLGIPVMVIHAHYPKIMKKEGREERFLDLVLDLYDTYDKGHVTLDQLIDCLQEECGLTIDRERSLK